MLPLKIPMVTILLIISSLHSGFFTTELYAAQHADYHIATPAKELVIETILQILKTKPTKESAVFYKKVLKVLKSPNSTAQQNLKADSLKIDSSKWLAILKELARPVKKIQSQKGKKFSDYLISIKENRNIKKGSIDLLNLRVEKLQPHEQKQLNPSIAHLYLKHGYYADALRKVFAIYRENAHFGIVYSTIQTIYSHNHKGSGKVALQSL